MVCLAVTLLQSTCPKSLCFFCLFLFLRLFSSSFGKVGKPCAGRLAIVARFEHTRSKGVQNAKSKENPQGTPRPLQPDQGQRDRQEVRAHNLDPGLVRLARCYGLYPHFSNVGFTSPKVRL